MARPKEQVCPNCGEVIPDEVGAGWFTIRANLPEEMRDAWNLVEKRLRSQGIGLHPSPRIRAGQLVEVLIAEYLAS